MAEKKKFNIADLSEDQQKDFAFVINRFSELEETRNSHYGVNLDALWADADRDYVPHRLKTKGKRVVATDEDKGWRGALVQLGTSDWQSDVSQSNPFIKIGVALSILVDQNPSGVFSAASKKYIATTELMKQLYQRSWEFAKSKQQLKLFIFNCAKYGWAVARTYPLRRTNTVKVLIKYDQENPEKSEYTEKEVVEYNDIMRENLDPRNVWIDDMAKPNNPMSVRDWEWRKVYSMSAAEKEFGKYSRWDMVQAGGNTEETIKTQKAAALGVTGKNIKEKDLVEIKFYENLEKDLFVVIANGVPVIIEPLPIADAKGLKKLSCWHAYWNIRHSESPYGIGIYEAIRYDQGLIDRIRNMTIDQLTLAIYKMFFYQGTQALTDTGDIKITPGIGRQVLDPKNINWLQIPGPGAEAWQGIQLFKQDLDEASGITDPLMGVVTGKTAFELAQAKESALKRMKTPLDNILDALNEDGYITVSLIQLLYSIPETYKIVDSKLIEDYLQEIEGDPELYERDEEGAFTAKVFREFPLNLDKDEKGTLIETQATRFFRIKPKGLKWEGIINIKAQSILSPSKQIDKSLELEMYNMLIPLLVQPTEIYQKVAKNIIKLYEKDPRDILPDAWLQETAQKQELFMPTNQQRAGGEAERFVPTTTPAEQPQGLAQRIVSRLAAPFRQT